MKFENENLDEDTKIYNSRNLLMKFEQFADNEKFRSTTVEIY